MSESAVAATPVPAGPRTGSPTGRDRAVEARCIPDQDLVNRLALAQCRDTRHRLYVRKGSGVQGIPLAEVQLRALRVARRLHALGVRPRDRVGVMAANSLEWVLLDLATVYLGGVVVGIEPGRHGPGLPKLRRAAR